MGLTLLEYKKQVTDPLTLFVINEFIASELLTVVPFRNIEGSGLHYNKADKLPGVGFRGFNEGHENSAGILNPQSEALKLFGGDLDVDMATVDLEGDAARQDHVQLKLQAARLRFERSFIKGDSASDPREFDGLQNRITGNQLIANGPDGTGNVLSLNSLDEAMDRVRGPASEKYLICNLAMRRRITQAARNTGVGGHVNYRPDEFGRTIITYNDAQIIALEDDNLGNEILPFNETSPDGSSTTDNSSIYCVRFGNMQTTGIQGRVRGQFGLSARDLGEIDEKPVLRTRVDWYIAMAVMNGRSAARLHGIQDGAAVV